MAAEPVVEGGEGGEGGSGVLGEGFREDFLVGEVAPGDVAFDDQEIVGGMVRLEAAQDFGAVTV